MNEKPGETDTTMVTETPGPTHLRHVADAAWADVHARIVVTDAELVVQTARVDDLIAANSSARRRVAAAEDRVDLAYASGSAAAIVAAEQELDDCIAAATTARKAMWDECSTIVTTGCAELKDRDAVMRKAFDAEAVAIAITHARH